MPHPLDLPSGYSQRPLALADASAVTAAIAASQLADLGRVDIEEADIIGDWQQPSYEVSEASVGVMYGDELIAYGECGGSFRGDAVVHPAHRGLGIGTAIAGWLRTRAGERGQPIIGMPNAEGSPGDVLLAGLGWFVRWHSWVLELPVGAAVPARSLPDGYRLRAAAPADYESCWTVVEDAFLEWSERARTPLADWLATVTGRPGFEPWQLRVVTDPAGDVVAVASLLLPGSSADAEVYVDKLATRKDHRGRGLAQALLADSFDAGRAHGARRCRLSTDSRTGALGLYEKVGMVVVETWVHRATHTSAYDVA